MKKICKWNVITGYVVILQEDGALVPTCDAAVYTIFQVDSRSCWSEFPSVLQCFHVKLHSLHNLALRNSGLKNLKIRFAFANHFISDLSYHVFTLRKIMFRCLIL